MRAEKSRGRKSSADVVETLSWIDDAAVGFYVECSLNVHGESMYDASSKKPSECQPAA